MVIVKFGCVGFGRDVAMASKSVKEAALEIIRDGLVPFAQQEFLETYGKNWIDIINQQRRKLANPLPDLPMRGTAVKWNPDTLLKTINGRLPWQEVFEPSFSKKGHNVYLVRGYFTEILDYRNRWAHFDDHDDDTARFLDTAERLLRVVGADEYAKSINLLRGVVERRDSHSMSAPPKLSDGQLNSRVLQEDIKAQHFETERKYKVDRNEYLKNVYEWYREHRSTLARIARAYYAKVPEVLNFSMVTRSEWLPKRPIPLNEFDLQLSWIEDELDPPAPLLEALDKETYSRFLERIAPNVQQEDRFCYRLLEASSADGTIKLVFSPSRYPHFINSCEALGYELAEWFYRNQKDVDINRTPTNGAYLTERGDPRSIFNLRMHSACPGISTFLLLLNAPQGDFFYLHKRSGPVLDSPGGLHVVPAGQFQPDTDEDVNHDRDFSIERSVIRELGEELLGLEKFKDVMRTSENFYNHPRLEPFVRGLREGFVRGYFLGLGFDPLPIKPGLLTALVIDASRLPPGALEFTDNWEGKFLELPLSQLEKWSKDERLIPDGATCLQLVQQHLKFLLDK
jgi:hypothetical protein